MSAAWCTSLVLCDFSLSGKVEVFVYKGDITKEKAPTRRGCGQGHCRHGRKNDSERVKCNRKRGRGAQRWRGSKDKFGKPAM